MNANTIDKTIICTCSCREHQIGMWRFEEEFPEEDTPYVYLSVSLCRRPQWWKRIYLAVRYVLGYRSRYGHFDEVLLDVPKATEFKQFLEDFIKSTEKEKT